MWQYFDILCYAVAVLILLANALLYSKASFLQKISLVLYAISVIVMGVFITQLWISLERPPLRTLAETRIWYSFFCGSHRMGFISYVSLQMDCKLFFHNDFGLLGNYFFPS